MKKKIKKEMEEWIKSRSCHESNLKEGLELIMRALIEGD